jgi:hypothetical protein
MEPVVMLDKQTVPDGYGGFRRQWVDGITFNAAIVLDSSIQAQLAMAQGVTGVYTVTTGKEIDLQFHDVFRRGDGRVFRVTTNGTDKKTPSSASLNMRQVNAEEWTLPPD